MTRLIWRAAASGTIETGEAMRLSMILRELRTAMEAQAEAATLNLSPSTVNFTILCVPKGTQIDPNDNTKFVWPDGTPCAAPEFKPFEPTHDWTKTALPAPDAALEPIAEQPMVEVDVADDPKITVLHPHQRRHSSEDDPATPGAA